MTVQGLFRKMTQEITKRYDASEAESITYLLFESIAGTDRTSLIRQSQNEVDKITETKLLKALERIMKGEPVQYVTGEAWFYGHKFRIRPGALIPRPETEELVQLALESAGKGKINILDIGTGSGCIAISLRKALPLSTVTATDISSEALAIARENAKNLEAEIDFLQNDILNEAEQEKLRLYDIIISNPPYIPQREREELEVHVREHEPALALFVTDERPMIFYEKIAEFACSHLAENGLLLFEIHEPYAEEICDMLIHQGFKPEIRKDMFGKKRMIRASRSR